MKRLAASIVLSVFLLAGYSSCSGDKTNDNLHNDSLRDTITGNQSPEDSVKTRFRKLVTALPVPFDILNRFSGAHLPFHPEFLNSPDNASRYNLGTIQAANLGVYGADLAYMISQDKLGDAAPFLSCVHKLSDAIVVPSAFDDNILQRYDSNKSRKDSLQFLINTSYRRIDSTLEGNDRLMLASLVIYGGWVESIYLTTQHIGDDQQNEKNKVLFDMLAMQQPYIDDFHDLLGSFPQDSTCNWLCREMKNISRIYPSGNLPPDQFFQRLHALRDSISGIRSRLIRIQ